MPCYSPRSPRPHRSANFLALERFNVDFTANTVSGSMVYSQSSDHAIHPRISHLDSRPAQHLHHQETPLRPPPAPRIQPDPKPWHALRPSCALRVIFLATQPARPLPGASMARERRQQRQRRFSARRVCGGKIRAVTRRSTTSHSRPWRPAAVRRVNPGLDLLKPAVDIVAHQASWQRARQWPWRRWPLFPARYAPGSVAHFSASCRYPVTSPCRVAPPSFGSPSSRSNALIILLALRGFLRGA